ncbi:MAG: TAXI family TRAP transporter solute-binding subunit [Aquisalimonadaceae bacterium]
MNSNTLKALCAGLAVAALLAAGSAAAQQRWTIGTNPTGTLYYTIGGAIAATLGEDLGHRVIVQPYAGSTVYLPLVNNGEINFGINSSLDAGRFASDVDDSKLRAVARIMPLSYGFLVRADSDIHTVEDLRGKRVVTEYRSLGSMGPANKAMLAAGGLVNEGDVESITVSGLADGIQGVVENRIDATGTGVGIPLTQQAHATVSGGIRYVPLGEMATSEFFEDQLPGLYSVRLEPHASRPGVREPVTVSGFDVYLWGNADMSDEDVADVVRVLHEHFDQLREDYPPLRRAQTNELASPTNTLPYHPGAIKAYKELGLWSEENEARDARLSR